MKPKVPWNTRLGNIGETEIESRLRYFCLPNKYSNDIGLDYYCELLENSSPTIPFYVQAKGTEHFDVNYGQSIKKSTITYWLQQSFPVYLIVYDEKKSICYWQSVEDIRYFLIGKLFESITDTIYLKINQLNILYKGKGKNRIFINKIKEDLNQLELFKGNPKFKGNGYVKMIPDSPRSASEVEKIKENVRAGLYSITRYLIEKGNLDNALFYCEFLLKFDRSHYNHFCWAGDIYLSRGEKTKAKSNFQEALKICERDEDWPKESMFDLICKIKEKINQCK